MMKPRLVRPCNYPEPPWNCNRFVTSLARSPTYRAEWRRLNSALIVS